MNFDLKTMAAFGVAGNFTGHLEQAGEAADFVNVEAESSNAPKAVFPTYIPKENRDCPDFLNVFPSTVRKLFILPVKKSSRLNLSAHLSSKLSGMKIR